MDPPPDPGAASRPQQSVDPVGKLAIAGVEPVTGAALICKPPVRGQHHFVAFWRVCESFLFATQPQNLVFPVSLADVRAELDQLFVNGRVHSVRICFVAGALDRYGPLVVGVAGAAPAPVTLVYYEDDAGVLARSRSYNSLRAPPGSRSRSLPL